MIATCEQPSPLDRWRDRLGGRRHHRCEARPLAALGYLAAGPVLDGLIDVEQFLTVLLYDEQIGPRHCALRLAGYAADRIPWGVRFGGPENCRFFKDLRLQPVLGGRGYRLDLANEELLTLGLDLERELACHAMHRHRAVREHVQLPKLWAGFRPEDTAGITGDGPELAAYAARTSKSPVDLMAHLRREHLGFVLYPLAWVSHHWQQAVTIFADVERFPRRQVFHLRQPSDDLAGYQGAAEFDFWGSRFRRPAEHHDQVTAEAVA